MCRVNTLPPFCIAFEDFANWTRISILHLLSTAIDDGTCDDHENYDDYDDIDDHNYWIPRPFYLTLSPSCTPDGSSPVETQSCQHIAFRVTQAPIRATQGTV